MNKSDSDIDRLYRTYFDEHESPVADREKLWQRIARRKNSRKLIPIFLLIAIVSYGAYYVSMDSPTEASASFDQESEERGVNTIALLQDESSETELSAINNDNPEPQIAIISPIEKNQRSQEATIELTNLKTRALHNSSIEADITTSAELSSISPKTDTQDNRDIIAAAPSNYDSKELIPNAISPLSSEHIIAIPTHHLSALANDAGIREMTLAANKLEPCQINKTGFNFNPFININAQLGLPLEQLSLTSLGADQTQLLNEWQEGFSPVSTLGASVEVGNTFSNGLSISTGLEYQRTESQYQAIQTITETTMIFDPMAFFFFDENDEIVWVGDTVTAITTFDRTVAHANVTELINIPVHVTYPLVQKGPFKISATAGAIINLSVKYEGRFLDNELTLQVLDDSNQSTYITPRIGIGIEGGLNASYNLTSGWELYLSSRYRYNRSSFFTDASFVSLSRDQIGLQSGLIYRFQW